MERNLEVLTRNRTFLSTLPTRLDTTIYLYSPPGTSFTLLRAFRLLWLLIPKQRKKEKLFKWVEEENNIAHYTATDCGYTLRRFYFAGKDLWSSNMSLRVDTVSYHIQRHCHPLNSTRRLYNLVIGTLILMKKGASALRLRRNWSGVDSKCFKPYPFSTFTQRILDRRSSKPMLTIWPSQHSWCHCQCANSSINFISKIPSLN